MDSRVFIRQANQLIDKIKLSGITAQSYEEQKVQRDGTQKEINQLFGALQNPTLPTAYRLRDTALDNGFFVDPKVQHRLNQFENLV